MVVEQEMADIYPPETEDLSEFLPDLDCQDCGFSSCTQFAEAVLKKKTSSRKCTELTDDFADKLAAIVELNKDPIPYNLMMEQTPCKIIEINQPGKDAPLIVTSNFSETVRIMRKILESTGTKAFLLPTHTHGYSVDNAVHEKMFKATEIWKAIKENSLEERVDTSSMIIPGLAESQKIAIRQLTRWDVMVGPVSGFLLPLFILKNR